MAGPPPLLLERLRRRVLSPLFDRLGYDLVPANPDWSHRPLSRREVDTLIAGAARSLAHDLAAAGITLPGTVADIVREFWERIPAAPVRQRRGGSGFNGALQVFVVMRALRPRAVIESGVFRGLTTWVIRQACPEAEIRCFDPDLSGLQYRDGAARYSSGDWSEADLSDLDPAATVAFFDDHVAQGRRVVEARARGIGRLLFDDDAAGHRIHAHGGPAHPTIAMIEAVRNAAPAPGGSEPIRWLRNGRAFEQAVDDALLREAGACIARSHAFDDLHRATGYSPARLTYVALDLEAASRQQEEVQRR
ncbi:hypothetical protein [Methylobacterium planeticum]|uniref:Uncharacterized protein n=1 Tax=Methylobacterium planeticum TaxID=2615211 RepID=A0A6N6MKS4_9HYPH|nr:hypothetical protein [Methylobacterium planeticum]KAB1070309.1 hypothetical protein F6X51_23135 [Methylobacterium planeticum]